MKKRFNAVFPYFIIAMALMNLTRPGEPYSWRLFHAASVAVFIYGIHSGRVFKE